MTTSLTAELVEKINANEKEAARLDNKILGIQSLIRTTKEIAELKARKRTSFPRSLLIKRNLRLDFILSLITVLIIIIPLVYISVTGNSGNLFGKAFGLLLAFLLAFVIYKNLTLKKLILPISLSNKQIEIIGEIYQWDEIENTFFVSRPTGRGSKVYFVIGLKDRELRYFDIGNQLGFKYNELDFSELVEHFKNISKQE